MVLPLDPGDAAASSVLRQWSSHPAGRYERHTTQHPPAGEAGHIRRQSDGQLNMTANLLSSLNAGSKTRTSSDDGTSGERQVDEQPV
jgi:hypothetical protein